MQTAFDCLLDAVPHGVLLVDAAGGVVAANSRFAALLGHVPSVLTGLRLDALVAERSRERLRQDCAPLLGACAQSGTRSTTAVQVLCSDGRELAATLELGRVAHAGEPALLVELREPLASPLPFQYFSMALEAAPTGMLVVNERGEILIANAQIERIFGYPHGQLVGKPFEALVPEQQRGQKLDHRAFFVDAPTPRSMGAGRDLYGLHRDTRQIPIEVALMRLDTAEGRLVVASIIDTSGRQLAERALRESEARHRALFEDSPVPLFEQDLSATRAYLVELEAAGVSDFHAHFEDCPDALRHAIGTVDTVALNQCALELYGADSASQLADPANIFAAETAGWFRAALCELWAGQRHFGGETTTRTLHGEARAVGMRIHLLPGHTDTWSRAVVSLFDLTTHEQAEDRLRSSLREKEVLLREVHHRVKNNLQIVSSLLNLKADTIDNIAAQHVFADCQARIRSLAFVHEHLYVASDLSHVPFGQYVRTLAAHLEQSFRVPGQNVKVRVAVGELNLSIDDAIPCGLIVNELVTNSLKHAFAPGCVGTIEIRMRRVPGYRLELSVSDDGKGLPSGLGPQESGASGLDLVYTFAEQLGAEVDVSRQGGTRFTFCFAAAGEGASRATS